MKNLKLLFVLALSFITITLTAQDPYIYVSDAGNFTSGPYKIVQFDPDGENPIVYIDEELGWPQDIVFLETQDVVLISNLTTGRITKYNSTTGNFIEDFATVAGGPTRMKIGADNLLYVLQWSNTINKVLRYQLDGTFVDEYTDVGVIQSIGTDWDASGNLYVSSFAGASVRKFDASGNDTGLFINTNLSGPTNLEIEGNLMYVLDWNAGKCVLFNPVTGDFIMDLITTLTNPEGLAFHPNGNILIGDNGTNSVREFDINGTDLGNFTNGGGLLTPNAVVLRDAIYLSVPGETFNTVFVTPTIGNHFRFDPKIASQIQSIEIYNLAGILIDILDVAQTSNWYAQNFAEGLYFLIATSYKGEQAIQRVIVSHK